MSHRHAATDGNVVRRRGKRATCAPSEGIWVARRAAHDTTSHGSLRLCPVGFHDDDAGRRAVAVAAGRPGHRRVGIGPRSWVFLGSVRTHGRRLRVSRDDCARGTRQMGTDTLSRAAGNRPGSIESGVVPPFYNLMNSRDAFGEAMLRPRKNLTFRTDVHALSLARSTDLWYSGGGDVSAADVRLHRPPLERTVEPGDARRRQRRLRVHGARQYHRLCRRRCRSRHHACGLPDRHAPSLRVRGAVCAFLKRVSLRSLTST
jgi:hypothetical protein